MPKLTWDQIGERRYETGVDHGVLFVMDSTGGYEDGVAWNGLTQVTEKPTGAESSAIYADNIKYLNLVSAEEFEATIEAYTYPDEWMQCDGSAPIATGVYVGQQKRKNFGLAYRTRMGNDTMNDDYGYKLHLIYSATASPSERGYQTVNDSPEAISFSWDLKTNPVALEGYRPTASITIDSTKVDSAKLASFEDLLFGVNGYTEVSSPTGSPAAHGWYERSGSAGAYVYTPSTDVTVDDTKTYYEIDPEGGSASTLPTPAQVMAHFAA